MRNAGCCGILLANVLLGGIATQYVLNFWLPFIVHHSVDVPFLAAALAGLFVGEITIPVAILTWILRSAGVV